MKHPRQMIRERFVSLVKEAGTDAASRVYDSRDFTLNTDTTPAIVVYTLAEKLEPDQQHDDGMRRRVMDLRVECYHTGDAGAAATDRMAWQVENAMRSDPTLGNAVEWCRLSAASMAFAEQGEFALYAAVLDVEITYCTHLYEVEGAPPVTVLLGFSPDVGPGNEPEYSVLAGGDHD
jgi:hypothetical protein